MRDVVLGLLAVVVGAAFCFRGYVVMRLVLAVWGAFVGFFLGAGLVAGITGDGFLVEVLPWVAGGVGALLLGGLAYTFYVVSVLVAMASIGFVLGTSAMVALDVEWTWAVIAVGVAAGAALAALAMVGRLPMLLLVLTSAAAGASSIVGGAMVLAGTVDAADLDRTSVVERVDASPVWLLLWLVIAALGVFAQLRALGPTRGDLRQEWYSERSVRR